MYAPSRSHRFAFFHCTHPNDVFDDLAVMRMLNVILTMLYDGGGKKSFALAFPVYQNNKLGGAIKCLVMEIIRGHSVSLREHDSDDERVNLSSLSGDFVKRVFVDLQRAL